MLFIASTDVLWPLGLFYLYLSNSAAICDALTASFSISLMMILIAVKFVGVFLRTKYINFSFSTSKSTRKQTRFEAVVSNTLTN